jgi:DNA mismatch repair ATPase MutS
VLFDECNKVFIIWEEHDNKKIAIGQINKDNFDEIIDILLKVNYIKSVDENYEKPKYKNNFAKKLVERMEKANFKKSQRNSTSFGKMISKYCADNKNGINMINVHQLSVYQFYDQWFEHNNIRQCGLQDLIYANTVSFTDLKSYDSQLWLK